MRQRLSDRLHLISQYYRPRIAAGLEDVADKLSAIADGDIILSKAVGDNDILPRQIMLYRDFVRTLCCRGVIVAGCAGRNLA